MPLHYTIYDPPVQQTNAYNWTSKQPTNLYFPDAWTSLVTDEFEYIQGTGRAFPSSFAGYCTGVAMFDLPAYGYATMRALVNLGVLSSYNDVPVWVYTHPRDPRKHDYRIFPNSIGYI